MLVPRSPILVARSSTGASRVAISFCSVVALSFHSLPEVDMNARQLRVTRSVNDALLSLRSRPFATPRIAKLRSELEAAARLIHELSQAQHNANAVAGADGRQIKYARRELRVAHLLPITRRGKLLLKGLPGIADALRVPHAHAPDAELLAATRRVAKAIRPHARAFRDAGFTKDFIAQLERAAKALAAKTANTDTMIGRRARATASLPAALAHAREIIAAIDSLVATELAGDVIALQLWRNAKRIPARMGRPRKPRRPPRHGPGLSA